MAEGDVYATLLTNDRYLPGAMVLAHALKDGGVRNGVSVPGTSKKLAVLVGEGRLSRQSLDELVTLFDYIIPVPIISGTASDNLQLLGRLELNETFTKINLWKQTQFNKIIYLDADILPIVPLDELFEVDAAFAASPDIGWPDCFNSVVMLLRPSQETYEELHRLVQSGQSFDGADQGLLNTHFEGKWHRLPFTYNCTPSASYQYTPAYRHFGSKVSVVHFIGASKPWDNRADNYNSVSFGEHVQNWWNVWDKHYVPKGSEKTTTWSHYKPPSAYEKTGALTGPPAGSVTVTHEKVANWAPPPPIIVPEDRSTTPTPQSVAVEDRAPTPKPTAQKPVVVSRPEVAPHRPVATRVFQDQPSNKPGARQEEFQKTWGAPSNVSSPIIPILKQSAVRPHYQHDAPFKVQDPMRPSTPESTHPIPTFNQHASYQPTFTVGGTTYVHRSDDPYTEEIQPDDEASCASSETTYVPPFEAPKSEWDPARSPPPANSSPEAYNITFQTYKNEWDMISTAVQKKSMPRKNRHKEQYSTRPAQEESQPQTQIPGVKPVFPWEHRAQPPTRVWADDPVPGGRNSDEIRSDDDDESTTSFEEFDDEGLSDTESGSERMGWGDFGVNQWDAIPAISQYVSALQRHNPQFKFDQTSATQQNPLYDDERPPLPVTTNPLRRRNLRGSSQKQWGYPSAPGITPPDKWVCNFLQLLTRCH
ncbi:nucleotide-diphospho-sugar transferase [Tirmania nivea]|nr:nucleotide-diphospho-sugar transferase [Tirmania nivea]